MSGRPSLKSLVCEEVFDERSQPSEEEVREYAARIGINAEKELHLLPLAREGLLKPLPKNWKPVYDPKTKQYYYFNFKTKQSSWEHPLDNKFRELVKKSRSESLSSAGEEDSKTSIKEELKSFEEAAASIGLEADTISSTKEIQMESLTQGVPMLKTVLSPLRSLRKEQENFSIRRDKSKPSISKTDLKPAFMPKPLFAQSLKDLSKSSDVSSFKSGKMNWDDLSSYLSDESEHLSDAKGLKAQGVPDSSLDYNSQAHDHSIGSSNSSIIGRFTVDRVRKIDIDSQTKRLDIEGQGNRRRSSDRFSKSAYGQPEFTLSGGGSIFLKSNKNKSVMEEGERSTKFNASLNPKYELLNDSDLNLKSEEADALSSSQRNIKPSVSSTTSSPFASPSTRSILRTPQAEKRLWDVNPQYMSVSEKALWKQQELEEEKKSVRFNLDKELNISFKLSDSSDNDSASEGDNVEGDDEDVEWNSNGSEELRSDLKIHQQGVSDLQPLPKKERHLSPLEEWAKKTWFSEKPDFEDKTVEETKILSTSVDNDSLRNQPHISTETSNIKKSDDQDLYDTSTQRGSTSDYPQKPSMDFDSDEILKHVFPESESNNVPSDISVDYVMPLKQTSFNTSELLPKDVEKKSLTSDYNPTNSESETDLVSSITKKLKDLASEELKSSEDVLVRDNSAREQAYRDWNVKKSDGDMYRPPLSRQQSQQQMLQMKQKIQESAKVGDRDLAFRAWNVTEASNEPFPKPSPKISDKGIQPEKHHGFTPGYSIENDAVQNSVDEVLPETKTITNVGDKVNTFGIPDDLYIVSRNLESKMKDEIEKLETEFQVQLKEKEMEYKHKFEIEKQEILESYKEKLQIRVKEETKANDLKLKESISQVEREADIRMKQLREQLEHKQNCTSQQILEQHQQALAAQEVENQAAMFRFREQHCAEMKALREQYQREEEQVRREHQDRIVNLREDRDGKRSREITDHLRVIEKLRCEKRLVEDKYRTLKEKYIKLKGEMKSHMEKKEPKQKENRQSDEKPKPLLAPVAEQGATLQQTPHQSDRSSEAESRPKTGSAGSSATSSSVGFQQQEPLNPAMDPPPPLPNNRPLGEARNMNNDSNAPNAAFLGRSFSEQPVQVKDCPFEKNGVAPQSSWCNFDHIKTTERNGNMPSSSHENPWSNQDTSNKSPLEALRHQLRTLDELEEQFPVSSVTDAYLRYPFTDAGCKELESAELEFFRHRIHLERDMIRQAKSSLHAQQSEYRSRMHNFHQRQTTASSSSPSTTLYQMAKEERELSDMEAKLRRTRTILSEKMIHLRHLENSLNRLTAPDVKYDIRNGPRVNEKKYIEKPRIKHQRRWDWKSGGSLGIDDVCDDVSSDSGGSSGFSSTEYTSDSTLATLLSHSGGFQKSKRTPGNGADINESLRNLNAEISEIWNVLCKQRVAAGLGPPPLLSTQATTWATPTNQLPTSRSGSPLMMSASKATTDKSSTLIERTNNLRQWLQKAKISATQPNSVLTGDKDVASC